MTRGSGVLFDNQCCGRVHSEPGGRHSQVGSLTFGRQTGQLRKRLCFLCWPEGVARARYRRFLFCFYLSSQSGMPVAVERDLIIQQLFPNDDMC